MSHGFSLTKYGEFRLENAIEKILENVFTNIRLGCCFTDFILEYEFHRQDDSVYTSLDYNNSAGGSE